MLFNTTEIIIIDDDVFYSRFTQAILDKVLKFKGDILLFQDARKALVHIEKISEPEIVGTEKEFKRLVLLDMQMPIMSGIDFLNCYQDLRENVRLRTKLCVLTSTTKEIKALKQFSDISEFLNKPIGAKDLDRLLTS